ncbi:MAG: sigma-54-dependent Fis family transcriptional regulator [Rhodobacteraceae bacterium]|nr:sigma-54-dependent Fis family transcriptional regulator [Paracoccaceae bacterium]
MNVNLGNQSAISSLLLVEDTPSLQMLYRTILRKAGYNALCASNGQEALTKFAESRPGVVLLDLMLPDSDGMAVMREMLALQPSTRIIVITANGSVNAAVEATRAGAHDFLVKPLGDIRLISAVANAHAESQRDMPADVSGSAHATDAIDSTFLGQSEVMHQLYDKIRAVATSMAPVFVLGESGTGKELCARAVHLKSARSKNRFVTFNCSAIPHELQQSELFGQAQRSNTPTATVKAGALIKADAGTLFLENIHDMAPSVQARLLNFLQNGTASPTGGGDAVRVDVRIICAATRDPAEEMRSGRLREDLYYRLFVIPMHVPPLRDRGEDVNILARHLLVQIAQEEGKTFTGLAPETASVFRKAPWRGNLRELVNVLRLAVVLHDGPTITPDMLPPELQSYASAENAATQRGLASGATPADVLSGMTMAEIEELVITSAIRRNAGSVPKAARELDIAPSTIYRKREAWSS